MGVTFNKVTKKWQATVQSKGCSIYLGLFQDKNRAEKFFKKHDDKYKRILEREKREWELKNKCQIEL